MSGYKKFAVLGSGGLGRCIIEALLEKQKEGVVSSVIVLSRSPNEELAAKGVKVVVVDYSSPSSIQPALTGIDVIVSAIGGNYETQEGLAVVAKAAGVRLFVPSEFGVPSDGATQGFFAIKDGFKKKLKNELHLPYTVYYSGCFPDWYFEKGRAEEIGFDFANSKIMIAGAGNSQIPWVSRPDVARFVAHTLTVLPREKLEWRTFRLQADQISLNKIAEEWKARSGKDVTISHRPRSELEDAVAKNPRDFISWLLLTLDKGSLSLAEAVSYEVDRGIGRPEELNMDFPDWSPKKTVDYLLETYGQ